MPLCEIPGVESTKEKSKGIFRSIGPLKQDLERGNSCFAKGIQGTMHMAQFIVAPRWAPFVTTLEARHSRLYRWVFEAYNIFKV